MNVGCQHCGQLYSATYLRHDLIHETDLPATDKAAFIGRVSDHYFDALQRLGWHCVESVYLVAACPACPTNKASPAQPCIAS